MYTVCFDRCSLLNSVAILIRWASPPDSVVADCPRVRYPSPRSLSTSIFLPTAGSPAKNRTPSSTGMLSTSSMVFPRTVTSSVSLLNRAPLHAPQVTSTSGMK